MHKERPEKLQFQVYDLAQYLQKNEVHATKPHSHSFYQIVWIYNKGGKHYVDFEGHKIEENTIIFISKNQIHYFDKKANHKGILLHFNESFLMHSDIDIFLKYNVFNTNETPCYSIESKSIEIVETYITLIKDEILKSNHFGQQQVIRYLLKSLLIVLEREHRSQIDDTLHFRNQYELQYLRFRELIEENYTTGITVNEYAEKLHISSKTLTTITKKISSKSPSQLISERIILEAKRLLAFTILKINEIGYRLGFEDASYFVKYFKRYEKKSPAKYREHLNKL